MRLHYGQGSCWLFAGVLLSAVTGLAQSTDWPQWSGPSRDFKSDAKGLAESWPGAGPRWLWSRALGEGYSLIAVVFGTLYTMYRRGVREVVVALEAARPCGNGHTTRLLSSSVGRRSSTKIIISRGDPDRIPLP
jgi:hypothetical protein